MTIRNPGRAPAQLLGRYQSITNGHSHEAEVQDGDVVGVQLHIGPGEGYQYISDAVIETPLGTMQGHYGVIDKQGIAFTIDIPVFRLAVPTLIH